MIEAQTDRVRPPANLGDLNAFRSIDNPCPAGVRVFLHIEDERQRPARRMKHGSVSLERLTRHGLTGGGVTNEQQDG